MRLLIDTSIFRVYEYIVYTETVIEYYKYEIIHYHNDSDYI